MSSQLAKIARAMPLDTTELAKEQRLRRFLDNERLDLSEHYDNGVVRPRSTATLSASAFRTIPRR